MEVETLLYTEEQEEKIQRLREEAERERESKKKTMKWLKEPNFYGALSNLKEGDPIFVKFDGKEISGKIIKVRKEKRKVQWTNTVTKTHEFTVYDVMTPLGEVTVPQSWEHIRLRYVEDLSHVEIPEELKIINTQLLLSYLKSARKYGECCGFSREQIKAELALRPHIKTKGEQKKFNKFKKKK